jgi:hypothetical protein
MVNIIHDDEKAVTDASCFNSIEMFFLHFEISPIDLNTIFKQGHPVIDQHILD